MNRTRRDFIKKSSVVGFSTLFPINENILKMNMKIRTAHIGVGGMGLNDLHSYVYISNQGDITQTVKGDENIEIPIYLSSMTDKDYGEELYLHYQIFHLDYVGIEKEINKNFLNTRIIKLIISQLNFN